MAPARPRPVRACKAISSRRIPMRLDAYTHYIPSKFLERMNKVAGDHKDIGKRMRGIPAIYDLDVRKKVIDQFKDKDYAQIISYAMPPIEHFAKGDDILEYLKLI